MAKPKNLLEKVATRKNLEQAWHDINLSARPVSHGMSEQTILDFRTNLDNELEIIRKELLSNSYRFGKVRGATIKKKGGKKRPLRIADIRDRVAQRAIARILEKNLSGEFTLKNPASHAYITGRGVQTAIKKMLNYHQAGYLTIFEADIQDFFGTVNLEKLLDEMVFPALSDTSINRLINDAIKMEVGNKLDLPEDDWKLFPESSSGLPQGGYLSPLLSNVYLSPFDAKMLEAGYKLIRYADDFIVMCKSDKEADDAYHLAVQILEGDLLLKMHPRDDRNVQARTKVVRVSQTPISFLGFHFNGSRIWPDVEKRKKLTEKLQERQLETDVLKLLKTTNNLLQGWISAYGFSDISSTYLKSIDNEVNNCIWEGLSKMRWELKTKHLSMQQRENSGVKPAQWYLEKIRNGLDAKDKELFAKYWMKE